MYSKLINKKKIYIYKAIFTYIKDKCIFEYSIVYKNIF